MTPLELNNLQIAVDRAVEVDAKYFGVIVVNGFNNQEELIVNTTENMMDGKLDYYMNAYNNDLTLKTQPKIRIAGFTFGRTVADIANQLDY